jgi:hypothetical protein
MNDVLLGWALIVSCGVLIMGYLLMLYAAYVVLPDIEQALDKCTWITGAKTFWGKYSHPGKMYRYAMLSLVLTSTRLLEKRGLIDVNQVNSLCAKHRRWINLPTRIAGVGFFGAAVAMALYGKFS